MYLHKYKLLVQRHRAVVSVTSSVIPTADAIHGSSEYNFLKKNIFKNETCWLRENLRYFVSFVHQAPDEPIILRIDSQF